MKVKLTLLPAGFCTQNEYFVLRSGWRTLRFPALVGLIEHPQQGPILFDTGYSQRFFDCTQRFPFRLYRWLTPTKIKPAETVINQLAQRNIAAEAVKTIIISHFHADHLCGVKDFPSARFYCWSDAYESIRDQQGFSALRSAFLPGLLPADFAQRTDAIHPTQQVSLAQQFAPFSHGVDLFHDGTLIAVRVPGHAVGQLGLFVQATDGEYFLAADAIWHSKALRQQILPHPLTRLIFADWTEYVNSFYKICQLQRNRPELQIIPYHCDEVGQRISDAD